MKLLDGYFKKLKSIYDYFGYDGINLPIEDRTEYDFSIDGDEIVYKNFNENYSGEWLHGIFKNKYVGKKYTMVIMSSDLDDGNYISIFDNLNENIDEDRCPDCGEVITYYHRKIGNCWSCGSDFIHLKC